MEKNKKSVLFTCKRCKANWKTYIIDVFGKENYQSYKYINFIETPNAKDIFNGELTAEEIYKRMTLI
ncbi:MAG: hypothetical protein MR022_07715, partial [Ruminococcus sp.]|nr:hypothetical protein [Ruminococcus sp.]